MKKGILYFGICLALKKSRNQLKSLALVKNRKDDLFVAEFLPSLFIYLFIVYLLSKVESYFLSGNCEMYSVEQNSYFSGGENCTVSGVK